MSVTTSIFHPSSPATSEVTSQEIGQVERALIDASVRAPVLFFYFTALTWLLGANLLGVLATLKLLWPGFLGDFAILSYGRIWPAYMDALTYGWGCLAGMGTAIWITARLCRVALKKSAMLVAGGVLWNIGVTLGLLFVITGNGRPFELLDFPSSASLILLVAYLMIGTWGVVMFRLRRPGHVYISIWYLIGAFFWFPWLYATANFLLASGTLRGVMQSVVGAWFAQNLIWLYFAAIGLATVYYLLPKITGKPIHSYYMTSLGFWSFAIFGGWTGMIRLVGAPIPAWMITVSVAAAILMLVPAATFTINYGKSMQGNGHMIYHSPVLRFTIFGAAAYTISSLLLVVFSFRNVASYAQFGTVLQGENHLGIYAFFTMVIFGSMYYIVPRLVGCEWFSSTMIRLHFWACAYGIGFCVMLMLVGGIFQGSLWGDHDVYTTDSVLAIEPFVIGRVIAWVLLTFGHVIFALHYLLMLLRLGRPSGTPTLLESKEEHA
jgi:cytochrome c oxidase cbb3-type subunit 1